MAAVYLINFLTTRQVKCDNLTVVGVHASVSVALQVEALGTGAVEGARDVVAEVGAGEISRTLIYVWYIETFKYTITRVLKIEFPVALINSSKFEGLVQNFCNFFLYKIRYLQQFCT